MDRPQSYISKIERGERRIDLVELRQLCNEVGADITKVVSRWQRTID
jgi:transcriptional regulator with XRE-family HTH domain